MKRDFMEIGVCGLSCRLCPAYHRETKSKCEGCKSEFRMGAPCPFHTCAVKKRGIDFCWDCDENSTCDRWRKFREAGKKHDSIVCYQRLENNIAFIRKHGIVEFERQQKARAKLLSALLAEFNEGRSKTLYCIAATVLEIGELESALKKTRAKSNELAIQAKSEIMHSILNEIAKDKNYLLKLRK